MDDTGPIVETVQIDADDSLAKSKMASFGSWVQGWGKKLTIAAGLVSGLAGSVQAAFAKSAADLSSYSVAQSKLAETHSLTTDELQALQLQAQQTGVSLDKLIESGQGASAAWLAAGNALGTSISPEAIAAGVNLSRAIGLAKDQVKALWMNIGAHLAPSMTEFWKISQGVLSVVIRWVKENGPLVQTVSKIASAAAVVAGALAGAGSVLWGVGAAIGWLTPIVGTLGGALVTFLVSPMGMVAVAATAGVAALLYFSGSARQMVAGVGGDFGAMWAAAVEAFQKIYQFVMSTVNGIKQALAAGDMALAAEIGWIAVKVAWYKGASEVVGLVRAVIGGDWLSTAIAGVGSAWTMLLDGFDKVVVGLENGLDGLWVMIQNGFETAATEAKIVWLSACYEIDKALARTKGLIDPFFDSAREIKSLNMERDSRVNKMRNVSADVNGERSVELSDRQAARSSRDNSAANAASGAAVSGQLQGLATASQGYVDEIGRGLRESLENATDRWQQGLAQAGQLPGLVPGAGGVAGAGGGGSPDQVRQSAMATFSAVAAGQTGATSSTVPTQQLQTQRTIAENTAETNRLLRNPRPLTVGV